MASFPQYGKHGKFTEIEYKTENTENGRKQRFATQKEKKSGK